MLDTMIRVNNSTKRELNKIGLRGETYDDIIIRLIKERKGSNKKKGGK